MSLQIRDYFIVHVTDSPLDRNLCNLRIVQAFVPACQTFLGSFTTKTQSMRRGPLLILLYKFFLTLCPPCLWGEYSLLPSLLRLIPGGQILLYEICGLLRGKGAVQHLCRRVPQIVFIVRIRVAGKDLIRAAK
jgi:hypothetical protein